ncbi:MAG: hypothetical protein Q9218_002212 [Villophora microphyllina]
MYFDGETEVEVDGAVEVEVDGAIEVEVDEETAVEVAGAAEVEVDEETEVEVGDVVVGRGFNVEVVGREVDEELMVVGMMLVVWEVVEGAKVVDVMTVLVGRDVVGVVVLVILEVVVEKGTEVVVAGLLVVLGPGGVVEGPGTPPAGQQAGLAAGQAATCPFSSVV